ncbi:hypothetical protein [Peribacillus muralis]|uniref:hypothetical protein n=1 Tax=Peribacillus muralis TaxID=264697 RepID=UPI003CFE9B72
MKSMPYDLKQKIRRYDKAIRKANAIHFEIEKELESYGVPYRNLCANTEWHESEPTTEGLAFITNNEGNIEENIIEIEEVFLYFANKFNEQSE